MKGERSPRRRRERGEGNAFMDTAREAYVRWIALDRWREIEDLRETLGLDWKQAFEEAGRFPGRGPYRDLWVARWTAEVGVAPEDRDAGARFAAIERAVAASLRDEEAMRRARGDRPLDEDADYKAFVDRAIERLLGEAAGEIGVE